MHFLYNNHLSSNWRGEFYSVFGRVFGTGSAQKTGTPTAWSSGKRQMLFFSFCECKGKNQTIIE